MVLQQILLNFYFLINYVVANGIPTLISSSGDGTICDMSSGFIIASIGRLSKEKNFELIINAMPIILEVIDNAKLYIYGEGEQREYLQGVIESLNLEQCVFLPGYENNTASIYSSIDVFVNCSVTEGMPITILEAMKFGCNIVATDIKANRYLLENICMVGGLCDLNSGSLAEAVISISNASESKISSQKAAYIAAFLSSYTVESMAKNYQSIYHELC